MTVECILSVNAWEREGGGGMHLAMSTIVQQDSSGYSRPFDYNKHHGKREIISVPSKYTRCIAIDSTKVGRCSRRVLTCRAAVAAVASSSNPLSTESSDSSPETQLLSPGIFSNPPGNVKLPSVSFREVPW